MKLIDWLPKHTVSTDDNDAEHLFQAYKAAREISVDPSTQNGAVLVTAAGDTVDAANGLPYKVMTAPERWERPNKYLYVEHAERNAIYYAARLGYSTEQATLYAPWYACCDCARGIIQSGITRVVGHAPCYHKTPERWRDSIIRAFEMLVEADVQCVIYDGLINADRAPDDRVWLRFDGELWVP